MQNSADQALMGLLHLLCLLLRCATDHFRSHAQLRAENALLRHQLLIAKRQTKRPGLTASDRAIFVWLYRRFPDIFGALILLTPQTVIRWHRTGYRYFWRWKSRRRGGRPPKNRELIELIRNLCRENPLWGAPRIHGEIRKLGYDDICEATVAKYMLRQPPGGRAQSWKTFFARPGNRRHGHAHCTDARL